MESIRRDFTPLIIASKHGKRLVFLVVVASLPWGVSGQKKVQMAPHKEAERLTGLKTGGISALALLHKNFPVYLDRPALTLENILISAGQRGINLEVSVQDFINVTQAKVIEAT